MNNMYWSLTSTMVTMENNMTCDHIYHVEVDKIIAWNTLTKKSLTHPVKHLKFYTLLCFNFAIFGFRIIGDLMTFVTKYLSSNH